MAEAAEVKFKLDDRELTVPPGTLVIEAARHQGIEVPSFCYYPGLALQAACRMCLVEVEKAPKLQTACTLVAMNGMVVRTNTPQVHQARKSMLEFLLSNHPLDCPVCDKGGECELQDMTFRYGADRSRFVEEKLHTPEVKWSNLVYYDAPRCILCFRCVRVCDEGMDVKALGVGQRGATSVIIPNREDHLDCEECGMCIDICPVGALTSGTYRYHTRPWEMTYVPTVCAHCSNGCKTTLSVRNHGVIRANNRDLSGINGDFLCAKGRFGFDYAYHPGRIRQPLVRRNGKLEPATWEDALAEAASRLVDIYGRKGPAALGFYGSNRTTNEENYLFQRIARASFATNNIDHHRTADYAGLIAMASRLDRKPPAPAMAPGETPANPPESTLISIGELESAGAFLLIGNDATNQNPLVAWKIRSSLRHRGSRLYILDPGEPRLQRKAQRFVRVPAGQEIEALAALAAGNPPDGSPLAAEWEALRNALAVEKDLVVIFGAVVQGTAFEPLASLAEARASAGQRTRLLALGDYCNSRGAADMGLLPDLLPGYASVGQDQTREAFGKLWNASVPEEPGLSAPEMLAAAAEGTLQALYVIGANPAKNPGVVSSGRFGKLELLIVHEMFLTETARAADIVLPALSGFEKDGTMTNTAGEVQLVRKGGELMGPRADFDILRILSHQLARQGVGQAIRLRTPEAAFEEIRRCVPGYGVSWSALLGGAAEKTAPFAESAAVALPRAVFSSRDSLFTSGSLTPYCRMVQSLREADSQP